MDNLSFNAAIIAQECITAAIKKVEKGIEDCGSLTHKDSKQSDHSRNYFSEQLESLKEDVEFLRSLSAALGEQAYRARLAEQDAKKK